MQLTTPSAHGVVVLDDAVVDCNECFCRLLGAARAELVGKELLALCPEFQSDGAFSRERWQRRWHAAQAGLPQWFPWQFRNLTGKRAHALVYLTTERTNGGAIVAHVHDLSKLEEVSWTQPDMHARLQQVLEQTKAIVF